MRHGRNNIPSTAGLVVILLLLGVARARSQTDNQVTKLIANLANDKTAWSASVDLQRLGDKAIRPLIANLRADPPVGEWHYSLTLAALEKMGPRAIPLVTAAILADQHETGESRQAYESRVRYKSTLIEALSELGPDAVPDLVRVAKAGPRIYHDRAFRAILGPALNLLLGYGPSDDPWKHISPAALEIRQRQKAVQPHLPVIQTLMWEDHKQWKPQLGAPELSAAFILALWGTGKVKESGIQVLRELANTHEPFYYHDEPIRMLAFLGDKSAPDLLKSNLPPSGYELRDQYLVSAGRWLFILGDPAYFKIIRPAFKSKDLEARKEAIRFAADSHDLRFVPILTRKLGDKTPTGVRTLGEGAHDEVIADCALAALRQLTFQSLPMDPAAWESWWSRNRTSTWRQLLTNYLTRRLAEFNQSPVWELNSWIIQLREAYDPTVLALLDRYIRYPQLSIYKAGPGRWMGFGPTTNSSFPWGYPPTVVTLLLGIAEQSNSEATRLLRVCLSSHDSDVRTYGALALTGFDRKAAIRALRLEATRKEPSDDAAEDLLRLGDPRGIGIVIENLARHQEPARAGRRIREYGLLLKYTQENIGYNPQGSPEQQNEGLRAWRKWWKGEREHFTPRIEAAAVDDRFHLMPELAKP